MRRLFPKLQAAALAEVTAAGTARPFNYAAPGALASVGGLDSFASPPPSTTASTLRRYATDANQEGSPGLRGDESPVPGGELGRFQSVFQSGAGDARATGEAHRGGATEGAEEGARYGREERGRVQLLEASLAHVVG